MNKPIPRLAIYPKLCNSTVVLLIYHIQSRLWSARQSADRGPTSIATELVWRDRRRARASDSLPIGPGHGHDGTRRRARSAGRCARWLWCVPKGSAGLCECSERQSKSAVADFDINRAHRVSPSASPMAGYVGQARLRWRVPTLAQGIALGLHRKPNPSPERAR
jgi:hypothetical protein